MNRALTILFLVFLTTGVCFSQHSAKDSKYRKFVKFTVQSIRFMDKDEKLKKVGISTHADIAIKVRLENIGKPPLGFYSNQNWLLPLGFTVEKSDGKIYWDAGIVKGKLPSSPGIESWDADGKAWSLMFPDSAIEWEVYDDSNAAGKMHAKTVLLKDLDDNIFEAFTDFYQVPSIK